MIFRLDIALRILHRLNIRVKPASYKQNERKFSYLNIGSEINKNNKNNVSINFLSNNPHITAEYIGFK